MNIQDCFIPGESFHITDTMAERAMAMAGLINIYENNLICGPEGSGKSLIASKVFKKLISDNKRPYYIDLVKVFEVIKVTDKYLVPEIMRNFHLSDAIIIENISILFGIATVPDYDSLADSIVEFIKTTKKPLLITAGGTKDKLLHIFPDIEDVPINSYIQL